MDSVILLLFNIHFSFIKSYHKLLYVKIHLLNIINVLHLFLLKEKGKRRDKLLSFLQCYYRRILKNFFKNENEILCHINEINCIKILRYSSFK